MAQAKRDQNSIPTLLALSSADGVTPVAVFADPVTHRLLVDLPGGSGTVTTVSVVTANGVSGSVANPTTTPAITLTLGAITPTSVNGPTITTSSGTLTITNLKTLTVSNTLTLAGTDGKTLTISASLTLAGTDGSTVTFGAGGTVAYVANKLSVFAATSSLELAGVISDETGSGLLVFATNPTLSGATFADATNIVLNTTTGTKIGTATNQKLGFFNATPVVQQTGSIKTALSTLGLVTSPTIPESDLSFTDITTGNVTSTQHGFAPKSPANTGKYLNGAATPAYAIPGTRETTTSSSATVTPNADTDDIVTITAQAAGLTLANPSGSPVQGQKLIIRIKDNASAQTIAYGTQYRALGNALPSTTVINKTLYLGLIYNSTDTKWDLVAVAQEA